MVRPEIEALLSKRSCLGSIVFVILAWVLLTQVLKRCFDV